MFVCPISFLSFLEFSYSCFQLFFAEVVEEGIIGGVEATTEEVIAADGVTGNHITKPLHIILIYLLYRYNKGPRWVRGPPPQGLELEKKQKIKNMCGGGRYLCFKSKSR